MNETVANKVTDRMEAFADMLQKQRQPILMKYPANRVHEFRK